MPVSAYVDAGHGISMRHRRADREHSLNVGSQEEANNCGVSPKEFEECLEIKSTRHFLPGVCHQCLSWPSPDDPLKYCGRCHLVSYCSTDCQQADWTSHKFLCKANTRSKNGANVFSDAKVSATEKKTWIKYRNNLEAKTEHALRRDLEIHEHEIFYFPRVCEICRESEPTKLKDCLKCHAVAYCSLQHQDQDWHRHHNSCSALLLSTLSHIQQAQLGVPDVPILSAPVRRYSPLPDTFIPLLPKSKWLPDGTLDISQGQRSNSIRAIQFSEKLTFPLTLLSALEKIGIGPSKTAVKTIKSLNIHITGAESTKELASLSSWEYLLHRLPLLKELRVVFIGPDLFLKPVEGEESVDYFLDESGKGRCISCEQSNKLFVYEMCLMTYHEFVNSQHFTDPDVIIAYNCGFHMYSEEAKDTWKPSFEYMTRSHSCPLIFTSYNKSEAIADLQALKKVCPVYTEFSANRNPYSGLWPKRDFDSEEDHLVFYNNQFVSAVRGNTKEKCSTDDNDESLISTNHTPVNQVKELCCTDWEVFDP
ncbi:unnamed protein product, partial [Meganyctiphanes norvegica]